MSHIQRIRQETATSAHRHLLLIETDIDDIDAVFTLGSIVEQLYPNGLTTAGALTTDLADRADQISRQLGTEHQAVLFDATRPFDPGLLAAVASTITAGGLMVMLTPTFDLWPHYFAQDKPPNQATARESDSPYNERSRFIERFISMFMSTKALPESRMSRIHLSLEHEPLPIGNRELATALTNQPTFQASTPRAVNHGLWQEEQERLLTALLFSVQTHEANVFIVEAARGRGKSSLLGRLAARLDVADIAWELTSLRRSSVASLERLWRLETQRVSSMPPLPWIPMDQVNNNPNTVLFVDEAADIPLPQLLTWANQRKTLILATTTQGYEGSGRGFSTRFYPSLTRSGTPWKRFTIEHPVRFGNEDPLEAFINRVLLLDANAQQQDLDSNDVDIRLCNVSHVLQDDLLEDEARLVAIFGLLREAHYQTTPMDLIHLLDAENLRLYMISQSSTVLAVAMTAVEGGIALPLHEPIMSGTRRLKDQLLPQLFARMANQPELLSKRYLRIVRIAVVPRARRLGLGTHLLNQIEILSAGEFDAIGASYSQDHQTATFWRQCRFTTFHEGFRAHPRSGHRTAAVLRTLKPGVTVESSDHTHRSAIESGLTSACDTLQANNLAAVSGPMPAPVQAPKLSELTPDYWKQALRFSEGARSYHDTRAALLHLWNLDPKRQSEASLGSLESAVCSDDQPRPSHKRLEAAIRAWARDTLALLSA